MILSEPQELSRKIQNKTIIYDKFPRIILYLHRSHTGHSPSSKASEAELSVLRKLFYELAIL